MRAALAILLALSAWRPCVAAADWPAEKCARYRTAWEEALSRFGREGLGQDFVARHAAFLESGCRAGRDICPRSAAEGVLADALTIAAMNAGMASTFLPFTCRGGASPVDRGSAGN